MRTTWFNLRVLLWHFQILKGRLFRVTVSYNGFWWNRDLLWKPIWLYAFDPREGWKYRNSKQYLSAKPGQKVSE
jgi:hypothetical protein